MPAPFRSAGILIPCPRALGPSDDMTELVRKAAHLPRRETMERTPYELDKEEWQKEGTAITHNHTDYSETKALKVKDPTLPFKRVERRCHLGICMESVEWVNGRWV